MKLSREPLITDTDEDGVRHAWRDDVRVYVAKAHEGLPHVYLGRGEETGPELSLGEARELRDALTELLLAAGANGRRRR